MSGGHPARSQRQRRRGPSRVLLAGLAVALIAVAGGSYVLMSGGQQPSHQAAAGPTHSASAPTTATTPAAPPGQWKFIQSRATDSQPLTLTELFPKQFTANGDSATMVIGKKGTHCSAALLGATLGTDVIKGHCTQVLRATYLSTSGQLMGTIGVLNLANAAAAERAGKATGATEFIDPLPAPKGPTHNIKKGKGVEEAEAKGHYLILIWAEFANLQQPSTAGRQLQLEQFAADLINGTANVSLTSRMVTGKPR